MGRPREFDVNEALLAALNEFWRKGYEGASLSDLTEAMGITRPSLYATFGNKEELFRKALDHYERRYLCFFKDGLAQPTARGVVERLLNGYADMQTDPVTPPGCLGTSGALACSPAAESVRQELVARRIRDQAVLQERLERARSEGDLPPEADPVVLARYVMTLVQGMAVQASSGASRADLHTVIATAMQSWPSR